jgi:hypothetical protein
MNEMDNINNRNGETIQRADIHALIEWLKDTPVQQLSVDTVYVMILFLRLYLPFLIRFHVLQ